MLERILEQEVMDTEQDAREYAAFDNSAVNDEFVARALELAPRSGTVLDIGTGPGAISILLARQNPHWQILAIDLGTHMLELARANVVEAGLGAQVQVACVDAKATGLPPGSFDMIVCNSLVHHIPEPEGLFREVQRLARAGAGLFIKDLHRPSSRAELDGLVATYASGCTEYQRRTFLDSLHASLTVSEIQSICTRLGFAGVQVRRCSDRHWCLERAAVVDAGTGSSSRWHGEVGGGA
jgi:2-polyprenyl-3-methyl-5-hydroxy-6-metoxy-1,4-benzoquinol methylase